jgi:hypothetical protein
MKPTQDAETTKRYVILFQEGGAPHSDTDDLEQAKHIARSLGNWNHATEVFDRETQSVVFKASHYIDKIQG